jgi:hypothetical protein
VIELARVIAPYHGFYISHERSEGRDPMWKNASDPTPSVDLLDAVKETIEVSEKAGVTAVASHLKAKGATFWGSIMLLPDSSLKRAPVAFRSTPINILIQLQVPMVRRCSFLRGPWLMKTKTRADN